MILHLFPFSFLRFRLSSRAASVVDIAAEITAKVIIELVLVREFVM